MCTPIVLAKDGAFETLRKAKPKAKAKAAAMKTVMKTAMKSAGGYLIWGSV